MPAAGCGSVHEHEACREQAIRWGVSQVHVPEDRLILSFGRWRGLEWPWLRGDQRMVWLGCGLQVEITMRAAYMRDALWRGGLMRETYSPGGTLFPGTGGIRAWVDVSREGALEPARRAQADGVAWQSCVRDPDRGPCDQETAENTRSEHRSIKDNLRTFLDAYGKWSYFAATSGPLWCTIHPCLCPCIRNLRLRFGTMSFRKNADSLKQSET